MIPRGSRWGVWWLFAVSCHAAGPSWLANALAADNPPWLPNDSAVQLVDYRQVRYLAPKHTVVLIRGAIRVANEAGLPRAWGAFVYNADSDHILSANAWIVSAGGKKTQAYRRAAFTDQVVRFNQYYWDAQRVMAFIGAGRMAVGDTVAWEIECDRTSGIEDTNMAFSPTLPTTRSDYEVIPAPGAKLDWFTQIPDLQATPGSEPGALRWELGHQRDQPKGRPNGFLLNPQGIFVRCVPSAADPKRTWNDFSRMAAEVIEPQMDPTGTVKAQAEALVAGKTERWERIRALTEFAQRDIVYLEIPLDRDTLSGWRPHPAAEVLRNRYGDCKDKVTLLVSLLRAIGEDGRLVVLHHGNPRSVDPAWPSDQFDHAIAAIPVSADVPAWWPVVDAGAAGKMVVFDPTDPTTPLGVLSSGDQGGSALVIDRADGRLVRLPATEPSHTGLTRKISATLDAQGGITASIEETRDGIAAAQSYSSRWSVPKEQYQAVLEHRIQERNPLCRDLTWSDDWQAAKAAYQLRFSFQTPSYARAMADGLLLLDPNILPDPIRLSAWTSSDRGSAWLEADGVQDEIRVALPPGCRIEELPDPWNEAGKTVTGQLSYRVEGNVVVFERRISRRAEFYDKSDYEAIRAFYRRLLEAERRPIVLRASAAP